MNVLFNLTMAMVQPPKVFMGFVEFQDKRFKFRFELDSDISTSLAEEVLSQDMSGIEELFQIDLWEGEKRLDLSKEEFRSMFFILGTFAIQMLVAKVCSASGRVVENVDVLTSTLFRPA